MNKSILFIVPDYHCSFFYRDELRKLGWKADIYAPPSYPEIVLFDQPDFTCRQFSNNLSGSIRFFIWRLYFLLSIASHYNYHLYYGSLDALHLGDSRSKLLRRFCPSFRFHLTLSKMFGCKVIYLPSGAPEEEMPAVIEKLGNLDEGVKTFDPLKMKVWFDIVRRYSDINIGSGLLDSTQYNATHIKYKVIDLNMFSPNIQVPARLKLPKTQKLRVLHSFMFGKERVKIYDGNIKGTKYILEAIERLVSEGYPIEYMYFEKVPSYEYRFIQAQADIVVEEIIRGGWGSTALECLALGKPVITYVRPEWEDFYYRCFPETKPIPIINANKRNIYEVLKRVVVDTEYRTSKAVESRRWAEAHLNPQQNVRAFAKLLEAL